MPMGDLGEVVDTDGRLFVLRIRMNLMQKELRQSCQQLWHS